MNHIVFFHHKIIHVKVLILKYTTIKQVVVVYPNNQNCFITRSNVKWTHPKLKETFSAEVCECRDWTILWMQKKMSLPKERRLNLLTTWIKVLKLKVEPRSRVVSCDRCLRWIICLCFSPWKPVHLTACVFSNPLISSKGISAVKLVGALLVQGRPLLLYSIISFIFPQMQVSSNMYTYIAGVTLFTVLQGGKNQLTSRRGIMPSVNFEVVLFPCDVFLLMVASNRWRGESWDFLFWQFSSWWGNVKEF